MIQMTRKPIKGWEGFYDASPCGNIFSVSRTVNRGGGRVAHITGRTIRPHISSRGYAHVVLNGDGRKITAQVHRLIALEFIPNFQGKPHVNHIDGNRSNNSAVNLEWVTREENMRHDWHCTNFRAQRTHGCRRRYLSHSEVRSITEMVNAGVKTTIVAKAHGVSPVTVRRIKSGSNWSPISGINK